MTVEEMIEVLLSAKEYREPLGRQETNVIISALKAGQALAEHVNGRYSDKGLTQPFADKLWELGRAYAAATKEDK